jgi:glycosyltransferase involved in cell wall biosynthesis
VAGDGAARDEVRAALPRRSAFLGVLGTRELAELYAAGDVYAWPAVNEAYGMSMLEAQAAGMPVVSVAKRGVPDVVVHGHTGLLAREEISALLRELLLDGERRKRLGRNAATFIAAERSLEAAADRLKSLLAAL